jgi:four helix bundle protein
LTIAVLQIVAELPETPIGKHIARQLLRAGTSGGANYEEARSAESRADFIHKVAVAVKEVRESQYWLLVIRDAGLSSNPCLQNSIDESDEVISILTTSRKTAAERAS